MNNRSCIGSLSKSFLCKLVLTASGTSFPVDSTGMASEIVGSGALMNALWTLFYDFRFLQPDKVLFSLPVLKKDGMSPVFGR